MNKTRETEKQVVCGPLFSYLVQNARGTLIEVPDGAKLADYYKKYGLIMFSYIKITGRYIKLATKNKAGKPVIYVLDLKAEKYDTNHGGDYYGVMRKCSKLDDNTYIVPDLTDDELTNRYIIKFGSKFRNIQAGILKSNLKYKNKWTNYYEYDLNSAYAAIIHETIPDTRVYRENDIVGDNEVGFLVGDSLTLVEAGGWANVIFPFIKTPERLRKYLDRWYKRKKNKDPHYFAKHALVQAVGYLQYRNPWLRAYIVEKCNKNMQKFIDENPDDWILVNTDAIYLTKPLENIDIGNNIGQFKLETGRIRTFNTADYELDDGTIKARGIVQNLIFEREGTEYLWVRKKEN